MAALPLFDLPTATPYAPKSETSRQGAIHAQMRSGGQCERLLLAYQDWGPLTDAEAAERLGLERTTICARRNELVRQGQVAQRGTRKGRYGVANATWGVK